jgi:glutaredoxin 3
MQEIIVYTMENCPYCEAAKRLLESKGLDYKEVFVEYDDDATWERLARETGFKTMPQIFIDGKFIGGYNELRNHLK